MTFATFVEDMLARFPFLQAEWLTYMDDDEPLAYAAFGFVLNPWFASRLRDRDFANVTRVCEFLEALAVDSRSDGRLYDLLVIELGEWLREASEKDLLMSHLGPETRRVCASHVSRLAL